MSQLYWQVRGNGAIDLVLLHGWGLNAEVWEGVIERLSPFFRLHLVDLPGYGRSIGFGVLTLEQMAEQVLHQAPERAVWLGWSMGGLIASHIALVHPERVIKLITVASSPCFMMREDENWPGIRSDVMAQFQHQLAHNFHLTVERFLGLQTLAVGNDARNLQIKALNKRILSVRIPDAEILDNGIRILAQTDLREELDQLRLPFRRIYGYLDGLVPNKVARILDERWPESASRMIPKAAHAPFLSHPDLFCDEVIVFAGH